MEKVNCQFCGKEEGTHYIEPTKTNMIGRRACFNCNYWFDLAIIDSKPNNKTSFVVTKGSRNFKEFEHLAIGQESAHPHAFRGFGGSSFTVEFEDGRTVNTTNLWYQGPVPEHFRHLFPLKAKVQERQTKAVGPDELLNKGKFV